MKNFSLVFLFCIYSLAQGPDSFICKKELDIKTKVFYLNGVGNNYKLPDTVFDINKAVKKIEKNTKINSKGAL